jgi:hypothetical protein
LLDLSLAAAKALNMTGRGLLNVTAVVEPGTTTFTTVTTTRPDPPCRIPAAIAGFAGLIFRYNDGRYDLSCSSSPPRT